MTIIRSGASGGCKVPNSHAGSHAVPHQRRIRLNAGGVWAAGIVHE